MKELLEALKLARVSVSPTVHKSKRNNEQNYKYVGHEQVLLSGAREALLNHGLVLEQVSVEFVGPVEVMKDGKPARSYYLWRGVHRLAHEFSGQEREYVFSATTVANDKAAFVASTALDRTAIMRVLHLAGSDEENPEHASHDRDERGPRERTRAPSQAKQQAAAAKLDPSWVPPLFGLVTPTSPEPRFSDEAKTHAGKHWSEEIWIVEGWLKDDEKRARFEQVRSAGDVQWAKFLVEHRRRRKIWEAAQPKNEQGGQAHGQ